MPPVTARYHCRLLLVVFLVAGWGSQAVAGQSRPGVSRSPVVVDGELEVLYEDYERTSRLVHFLHANGKRIPLRFQGDAPELPNGARIRVSGDLAEGAITTKSVTTLAVSAAQTFGSKSVLVILFNFADNPGQPFSADTIASVNTQVQNFYLENSYGQASLTFTVAGWFTIGAAGSTCDYSTWATQAESAAAAAGYNPSAYDRRVFAFPWASVCAWSGMGNVGGPRSYVNGSYAVRTVAHEQGHNFGNYHSHSLNCDGASCAASDYGDDRDVLGYPGTVGHMNAFQKERLGWLNYGASPPILTVTAGGTYWIDAYETPGAQPKALKIWNPATSTYYYVENRGRRGFDSALAPGVVVHTGSPSGANTSYQTDVAPGTSAWDSTLDPGQTFTDPALGLDITTLSSDDAGAMISVSFAQAACAPMPPAVSLSPASQIGTAGSPAQYSVSVTNNDGQSCAASAFAVSAVVPAGWSSSAAGAGLASVAPGATAQATVTVTPPAGTSGTYSFAVNAVGGASGYSNSSNGSLTILSALDVQTSAALTVDRKSRAIAVATVVRNGSAALVGAAVTVTVTSPSGTTARFTATTNVDGTATVKYSLKPRDLAGTYQITATVTYGGVTATSATSIAVQ